MRYEKSCGGAADLFRRCRRLKSGKYIQYSGAFPNFAETKKFSLSAFADLIRCSLTDELIPQATEVADIKWIEITKAGQELTYEDDRRILNKAMERSRKT